MMEGKCEKLCRYWLVAREGGLGNKSGKNENCLEMLNLFYYFG